MELGAGGAGLADRRRARRRCPTSSSTTSATRSRRPSTPTTARSRSTQWDTEGPGAQDVHEGLPGRGQAARARCPTELGSHVRYPEDLFKVQRDILTRYHVDRPGRLLQPERPLAGAERPDRQNTQDASRRTTSSPSGRGTTRRASSSPARSTRFNRENLSAFISGVQRPGDLRADPGAPSCRATRPSAGRSRCSSRSSPTTRSDRT